MKTKIFLGLLIATSQAFAGALTQNADYDFKIHCQSRGQATTFDYRIKRESGQASAHQIDAHGAETLGSASVTYAPTHTRVIGKDIVQMTFDHDYHFSSVQLLASSLDEEYKAPHAVRAVGSVILNEMGRYQFHAVDCEPLK